MRQYSTLQKSSSDDAIFNPFREGVGGLLRFCTLASVVINDMENSTYTEFL